ncbi:MAG: trypsin-like peptidase domain-containing protein [Aeromicrobium sp.]|uniref:S1C family serine protease n=1 Tax=Aeromicrobium sp. TaxID=1871063 RepID=UPI0039E6AEC7
MTEPSDTPPDESSSADVPPPPGPFSYGSRDDASEEHTEPTAVLTTSPVVPPPDLTTAPPTPTPAPPVDAAPPHGHGGAHATPPGHTAKPKRRTGRKVAAAALVIALAGGAGYGGSWLQGQGGDDEPTKESDTTSALDEPQSTEKAPVGEVETVAAELMPSVVQINVRNGEEGGSGSGVILSEDGEILTNNHVIEAAAEEGSITVAFSDGTNTSAEILGRDPVSDLAVIKAADVSGLKPATFGTSADLTVGQTVVAIGSPFGLESTVTQGIVSALNRPVESADADGDNATVFPAVQTDAAINPGNSGGPLVDLAGNVIGINSAIRTGSDASGSIGLGFAIPIDLARRVAQQLRDGDTVEHARIGVTVAPATEEDELTGIGAEVTEVTPDSPGDKAGLKKGDIITSLGGVPIGSSSALVAAVRGHQPDDEVEVTYLRDGESETATVTLESDNGELSQE